MKFREMMTTNQTLVLGGKNDKNNEELVEQADKNEEVFHTKEPGSPFVNIKGRVKKGDIKQAAIFCAAYSRDWKKNKGDVIVHRFKKRDMCKEGDMKTGTFGVKKFRKIKIKKEDIKRFLKEEKE